MTLAIAGSYGIGRALGLAPRLAILVACGNSICGNSAIAAAAPVIGADGDDVALVHRVHRRARSPRRARLPLLVPLLGLSPMQYGVLAGLTVYAVPQVLAATAPVAALSVQVGTLVKLVRVLMLGPVVLALSLGASRLRREADSAASSPTEGERPASSRMPLHRLVPWFIPRLPDAGRSPLGGAPSRSGCAPHGRDGERADHRIDGGPRPRVDVRSVVKAGPRVTLAVVASLAALTAVSLGLIRLLGIA